MEAYVKYNYFHMEQRPRFKPDPFKAENFYYNEEQDFCICPMGQKMQRIGTRHVKQHPDMSAKMPGTEPSDVKAVR